MESVIFRYSEFFDDDGGMQKVRSDFVKLGDDLVAEAKRIKKEFNDGFTLDSPEGLARYEAQVEKLTKVNEAYRKAKEDLLKLEQKVTDEQEKQTAANIRAAREKGAVADATRKELQAERELDRGIQQTNATKKSDIALSVAQQQQAARNEQQQRKLKDAYGEASAELNQLFRASASVAVQMHRLEEAGKGASPEYARLASEFSVLQGRTQKLDKALKDIDKSLGRNQRNVGNYQFDALGNSIQQILRETPSAAVSLNTFFLAISNNLPAFFDSVQDLNKGIKELKDTAAAATAEFVKQQAAQQTAAAVSSEAEDALSDQVEGIVASIGASQEQAAAIREQVVAHLSEIETTGTATAETVANTESVLVNAGATVEQTAAVQRQIVATAQATAVTAEATAGLNAEAAAAARASAALTAQPSILKRVASSLFSVNTALTLGVLALTLYGGKLVDIISNLFDFNTELTEVEKSQLRLSKANDAAAKEYAKQEENLKSLQQTAKNGDLDPDSRALAVQKLREQFQYYYKDLSDAQILSKEYAKSESELLVAINKRTQAQERQKEVDDVKGRIIDLRSEIKARDDIYGKAVALREESERLQKLRQSGVKIDQLATLKRLADITKEISALDEQGAKREAYNDLLGEKSEVQKKINESTIDDLKREADALEKFILPKQKEINKLQAESILLDYKKTESKRALRSQQIKSVDYEASEYALIVQQLQNTIDINQQIFDSDRYTLDVRLNAREKFISAMTVLAQYERTESLRQLKITYEKERKETIRSADGKTFINKYTNHALKELEKQYQFDTLKAEEEFQGKLKGLREQYQQLSYLETKNLEIQSLQGQQQYFSKSAAAYAAYGAKIALIQEEINKVINPFEEVDQKDNIDYNEQELARMEKLRQNIEASLAGRSFKDLDKTERKTLLEQIKAFEKQRTDIEQDGDKKRLIARLDIIKQKKVAYEKEFATETSEYRALELERQQIEKDLANKRLDELLQAQKDKAEAMKKFIDDLNKIVGLVLDRMLEITQQRVEKSQQLVNKQNDAVEDQQDRAKNGLTNTLKFEQEELAKREAELIKQQKREERLQKIKAIYTSYSGYADKDPDTAIQKALRDFAILESVTASFEDGGIVGKDGYDHVPTNRGITMGRSHRNKKGVLAYHQGGEGFWNRQEVAAVGESNFYKFKAMAGAGLIDENFFERQRQQFNTSVMPVPVISEKIIDELKDLKRAIDNKPVPNIRAGEIVDGTMKIIEEYQHKNKTVRNIYITKKPRP